MISQAVQPMEDNGAGMISGEQRRLPARDTGVATGAPVRTPSLAAMTALLARLPRRPALPVTWHAARLAAALLALVAIVEVSATTADARVSLGLHITLLAFLCALAAREQDEALVPLFLGVAAVPAVRIAGMALPLPHPAWSVLAGAPVLLVACWLAREARLTPTAVAMELPRRRYAPLELLVYAAGGALGTAEWILLRPTTLFDGRTLALLAAAILLLFICAGLIEALPAAVMVLAVAVKPFPGLIERLPALARKRRRALRGRLARPAISGTAYLALAVLALVAAAESIVAYGDPRYGLGLHIILLALALGLGARETDGVRQAFFLSVAIAPIIRIVSTGMPLRSFPEPFWYVLTSIPLFLVAYLIAREVHLSPAALKLRLPARRHLPLEAAVALSGIGLGYVEWSILHSGPLVDGRSLAWMVGGALILIICTGLVEELLFRGLIQHVAGRFFGWKGGIAFTAAIFAVLHIGHLSILDDLFVAGVGLYFSLVSRRTGSLLGVTLAHGAINIMLFIVLPLSLLPRPL